MDYFLGQPRSRRTRCYLQLLQSRSLWGIRPSHEICLSFMWWIDVYFSAFAIFIPFWANSQIVCVDIFWNFWTPGTKQVTFFLPDEVFLDGSAEIFFLKWELHPSNWFRSGGKVATNQVKGGIWSADIFNVLLPSGHMLLIHVYIYIYIYLFKKYFILIISFNHFTSPKCWKKFCTSGAKNMLAFLGPWDLLFRSLYRGPLSPRRKLPRWFGCIPWRGPAIVRTLCSWV